MFFGKVFGAHRTICRIRVICKCEHINNQIQHIDYDVRQYVGDTGCVFVPNNNYEELVENQLLFFETKENEIKREDGDIFLLKQRFQNIKAMPLIASKSVDLEALLQEPFYNKSYTGKTTVFAKINQEIYGAFNVSNSIDHFKLETPANQQKVICWDASDVTIIEDNDYNQLYITDIPQPASGKDYDVSSAVQLKNWFKRKIKKNSNGEYLEAVKTLEPFIEHSDSYADNDLEKQKWEKIKKRFATFQLEYDELSDFLSTPQIEEKFHSEIKRFKDEIIEERAEEISAEVAEQVEQLKSELEELKTSLEVQKRENKKELNKDIADAEKELQKLHAQISEANTELQTILELKKEEEKAKGVLEEIVEKFETSKDEIVQNLITYQSFLPQTTVNSSTSVTSSHSLKLPSNEEAPTPKEMVVKIKNLYSEYSIDVGAKEVFAMISALSIHKGIIVPSPVWSRLFADANPRYEHLTITVDPSWKGIRDLWDSYLKYIVTMAKENPENTFIVHFDGINNSVPEVWMNAVHSLVAYQGVRVPVDGLPFWPENIQFFFSPADHRYSFALNEAVLTQWPAIRDSKVDKLELPELHKQKVERLNIEMNALRNRDEQEENEIAQMMLWEYPLSYKTEELN